jgi:hypothetical protein
MVAVRVEQEEQELLEMVVAVEILVKTVIMPKIIKVEHQELQETPLMDGVTNYQQRVLVTETAEATQ